MIINQLTLQNIRSYSDHKPITFTPGTILFHGDVGSGKSTILLAIEFALFGLGDVEGSHLLRGNMKEGCILLEFKVNGKEYKVFRSLVRKRKYVRQGEGYIVEDGVRTDYSVSEMKERILEILDFKERPQPKTSSLIFRYAVFTPQEMMKEVLFQNVDRRLDTLRRAFGIEDYSIVRNNVEVLRGHLRENITYIRGQTKDLDDKRSNLQSEETKQKTFKEELKRLSKDFRAIDNQLKTLKKRITTLTKKKDKVLRLESDVSHLQEKISSEQNNLELLTGDINTLRKEKQEAETAKLSIEKLKPKYDEFKKLSKQVNRLEKIDEEYRSVKSLIDLLEVAIGKTKESLKSNIKKADKEVKRLQAEVHKTKPDLDKLSTLRKESGIIKRKLKKLPSLSRKVIKLKQQRSSLDTKVAGLKTELNKNELEWNNIGTIGAGAPCPRCHQELTVEHFMKLTELYEGEITELGTQIKKIEQDIPDLEGEISSLEKRQSALEGDRAQLTKLMQSIATIEEKKRSLKQKERDIAQKIKALQKDKENLDNENFASTERKNLAKANRRLQKFEPKKTFFDELKEQLKKHRDAEIERLYTENKQIAGRYKNILKEMKTKNQRHKTLEQQILADNKKLASMKTKYDAEKTVLEQLKELDVKRDSVEHDWKSMNGDVFGKKVEIKTQSQRINDLKTEISDKETLLYQRDLYREYLVWVDENFTPATEDIERHVMASIREDFDELFQRWFSLLMETGDITVQIDDNFTPFIEQNGYELDVKSLSGGEKTSVALAYRLALNVMVKRVCEAMHSNLLMLDEPTDGFSNEQLVRMRDILDELNCEQVIMVSHERELEGFVDKIYRVQKEAGISSVIEA